MPDRLTNERLRELHQTWLIESEVDDPMADDSPAVLSALTELLELRKEVERLMDTAELAWGLIANAYGGNWGIATDVWREAAERWRDERWHPELEEKCLTD